MTIERNKKFDKKIFQIKDYNLLIEIEKVLLNVEIAISINEIKNLKKLKGYKNAYRIKIGSYRIGIIIENAVAVFWDIAHRKDIYNQFPQ
jgi:mRNA interferase RelE/StbE